MSTTAVPEYDVRLTASRISHTNPATMTVPPPDRTVLDESDFRRIISLERRRTERSKKPFLLMLLDSGPGIASSKQSQILQKTVLGLALSIRETDTAGWYRQNSIIGVILTDLSIGRGTDMLATMLARVSGALRESLTPDQVNQISFSFHFFPEKWPLDVQRCRCNPILYPDLIDQERNKKQYCTLKRVLDIIGSVAALILLSPIFAAIAVLAKYSSKGPVIFKQERLGQFGETFTFLKFRTMYVNSDLKIHQDFITHVIKGDYTGAINCDDKPVYKMTHDPRVTSIGRFLRRTSLDELPQFFNVLKGDMSLVGPRPPLTYEYSEYDLWHRRRVIETKPGMTGLWQVRGRSRVAFDDMVRLDLRYGRSSSVWLDLKILLETPRAVLFGGDAF